MSDGIRNNNDLQLIHVAGLDLHNLHDDLAQILHNNLAQRQVGGEVHGLDHDLSLSEVCSLLLLEKHATNQAPLTPLGVCRTYM